MNTNNHWISIKSIKRLLACSAVLAFGASNHSVFATCGTCGVPGIDPGMCCGTIDIHNIAWPISRVNNAERVWSHQVSNGRLVPLMECLNCISGGDLSNKLGQWQSAYTNLLGGAAGGDADQGGPLDARAWRLRNLRQKTVDRTRALAGQYGIAVNENTLNGG